MKLKITDKMRAEWLIRKWIALIPTRMWVGEVFQPHWRAVA